MHSNGKMKFLRKRVGQMEPFSVMWISPRYDVNIGSMGNPLIPDAEKGVGPFGVRRLNRALGSSDSASSAYQKWPNGRPHS